MLFKARLFYYHVKKKKKLARNMGKILGIIIKLRRYLIMQPGEIVVLSDTMKKSFFNSPIFSNLTYY